MLCLVFSPSPLVLLFGEVAEWFNAPDSKSDVLSQVPGVRIPPSPHRTAPEPFGFRCFFCCGWLYFVGLVRVYASPNRLQAANSVLGCVGFLRRNRWLGL